VVLVVVGIAVPVSLMVAVSRSPARQTCNYLFG
jgi:hypothetical protein